MSFAFNAARKVILVLYAVGMLLACLFVPWMGKAVILAQGTEWPEYTLGFAPVWSPPDDAQVDLSTMGFEIVSMTILAGLAFLLAGVKVAEPGRPVSRTPDRSGMEVEQSLRSSFWGQWTLLSLKRQNAWVPRAQGMALRPESKRKEAEETLLSLFVVSFTLFCVQVSFYLMNHVFDSPWFSWLAPLGFGVLFIAFAGFYAMTLYVSYCEMEKRFWTPLALANTVLCLLNWYLPRAAFRFSVIPTVTDLAIWSACTLFFCCGVFVRLNGR